MIQHRPYDHKVDVYSFGIVLWELITGMLPFTNMTAVQAAFAVVNKGARPVIPQDCLPSLTHIMTRCWDANPEVRPPFTEIVCMLESAEMEIVSNVRKARFRCCMSQPMTTDWSGKWWLDEENWWKKGGKAYLNVFTASVLGICAEAPRIWASVLLHSILCMLHSWSYLFWKYRWCCLVC